MVLAGTKAIERGDGGATVGEGQYLVERNVVACGPALPSPFDDLRGVDECSVHIEEDGLAADLDHYLWSHCFCRLILGRCWRDFCPSFCDVPLRYWFRCGPVCLCLLLFRSGAEARRAFCHICQRPEGLCSL